MITIVNFIKTHLNSIFNFIREFYYIIFAISIITLLLYIRLLPRISRDLWEQLTQYQILYLIIRILLVFIQLIFIIKLIFAIKNDKKVALLEKIQKPLIAGFDYILNILSNFYQFLAYIINIFGNYMFKYPNLHYNIIRLLSKKLLFLNIKLVYIIFILLLIIPKIIFVIAFSYDVFVTQHLHYSFKCIPFLLIPLIESFIVFIFMSFYNTHFRAILSYLKVVEYENNGIKIKKYQFVDKFLFKIPEGFKSFPDYYNNHYLVLQNINKFFLDYIESKKENKPLLMLSLFLSFFRLAALFYILIHGIT